VAVAVREALLGADDVARGADAVVADGLEVDGLEVVAVVEVAALAPVATAISGAVEAVSAPGARTSATF
jgi:hypothetical protein